MRMSADPALSPLALAGAAREVEEFVSTAGWDQAPQLFALVSTAELLAREPGLADQLNPDSPLTPVAQDELPEGELDEALGGIAWPESVTGCALCQEIVVLPPDAEAEVLVANDSSAEMRRVAAEHPQRKEARLVAAVNRDGSGACVLRVRGDADHPDEIVEHPELAPNLIDALRQTFA